MGPLVSISEVLMPLELSGGTQDNHENQKPLILSLCAVRTVFQKAEPTKTQFSGDISF